MICEVQIQHPSSPVFRVRPQTPRFRIDCKIEKTQHDAADARWRPFVNLHDGHLHGAVPNGDFGTSVDPSPADAVRRPDVTTGKESQSEFSNRRGREAEMRLTGVNDRIDLNGPFILPSEFIRRKLRNVHEILNGHPLRNPAHGLFSGRGHGSYLT
jgi:hypothetical protein